LIIARDWSAAVIKTLFLVPVHDNEETPISRQFWTELDTRLLMAFGGMTRNPGVTGVWRAEDRIYEDESIQYNVALVSWWDLPTLLSIVDWVRESTRQEAIYVEIAGVPEIRGG
jgi:hypothetical protein